MFNGRLKGGPKKIEQIISSFTYFLSPEYHSVTLNRQNVVNPSMQPEINYYDKDMMKNPLLPKKTHAPVPANLCVFKLKNLKLVKKLN
jgi:hypothetical protein